MSIESTESDNPQDPFANILIRAEAKTVSAVTDQLAEFGNNSLEEKFADFTKKQPALAYRILSESRNSEDPLAVIGAALLVFYSLEAQGQSDLTTKHFPSA